VRNRFGELTHAEFKVYQTDAICTQPGMAKIWHKTQGVRKTETDITIAILLCNQCPVIELCKKFTFSFPHQVGVWAGEFFRWDRNLVKEKKNEQRQVRANN
jgi:hypothetical protein